MEKGGSVYIMGNEKPVLYIGVTSNLLGRVYQHRNNLVEGFTKKYNLHKLLYFENFEDIENAIIREKQLKRWHREWKINLIRFSNPEFKDLFNEIL
jgi:putative endonuclease